MKREWKPGDVAFIPSIGRAICTGVGDTVLVGRPEEHNRRLGMFTGVRPLVVIDPEDREQVERFMDIEEAISDGPEGRGLTRLERVQAALREFASPTPPKPDEPTGLGAVVEDKRLRRWTRAGSSAVDGNWLRVGSNAYVHYDHIDVVRVLSEGVQS